MLLAIMSFARVSGHVWWVVLCHEHSLTLLVFESTDPICSHCDSLGREQ